LKIKIKQKPEDMKLIAIEDKNTRNCQKESINWICTVLHRGHDDSHCAMMKTDLALKETEQIF
jgi:hypothetical protein